MDAKEEVLQEPRLTTETKNIPGYTLCPDCSEVPLISIIESLVPDKIIVECQSCNQKKEKEIKEEEKNNYISNKKTILTIQQYFDIMSNKNSKQSQIVRNCEQKSCKNKNGTGATLCTDCKKWYCNICLKKHNKHTQNHNLFSEELLVSPKCDEPKHDKRELLAYCYTCKKNICQMCKSNEHHNHIHKLYCDINKMIDINNLKEKMNQQIFQENCKKYRDRMIDNLNKQIERVKKAYEDNFNINQNIFKLLNLMIKTYTDFTEKHSYAYNILHNIIKNSQLNIKEFEMSDDTSNENVDKLIRYYKTNYIFGDTKIDNDKIQQIKRYDGNDNSKVSEWVTSLTILDDDNLCSTRNNSVTIYDKNTFEVQRTFKTKYPVNYLLQLDHFHLAIAFGKYDKIEIYEINEEGEKIVGELIGKENEEVLKIIRVYKDTFAFCTKSQIFMVRYSFNENGELVLEKMESPDKADNPINSIIKLKNENTIISGSISSQVNIYSLRQLKNRFKDKVAECLGRNSMIEVEGKNMIIMGGTTQISILEVMKKNTKNPNFIQKIYSINNLHYINSIVRMRMEGNNDYTYLIGEEYKYNLLEGETDIFEPKNYLIINFNKILEDIQKGNKEINERIEDKEQKKIPNRMINEQSRFQIKKVVSTVNWNRRCLALGYDNGEVRIVNY